MIKRLKYYRSIAAALMILMICYTQDAASQIKIGENNKSMNTDAMLEIESTNKGFLLPRVSLISTASATPLKSFASGMVVYNISNTNDVSPGLYYSDGLKWIKANNNASNAGLFFNAQNHTEIVTTDGQTTFKSPYTITDQSKIFLYRNGILIMHTIGNNNSIIAELPCKKGDQIRIIQLL
ncbi:MAG: hypothetical protein RLZ76_838 [Bacteroidota bacterium]|jgi:hypothetical protein